MADLAFAASDPAGLKSMFLPLRADRPADPSLEAASRRSFDLLQARPAGCQESVRLKAKDNRIAALFAWCTVHGRSLFFSDGRFI
jgi:hypothetical protein